MILLKKIDIYIFKRLISIFAMTFFICIFILLMQFLWKNFADLVGKGIGLDVIGEFFLYAIFNVIPMALPLAILLASLMTFGNLGENFELTAMKSAGVSLFRIIRPLIFFISFVSIGAFFFSNYIIPITQKKLFTLILSLKQKSPELDVPVGEFYSGIDGYNLYVRGKEKGLLKDMMIYDFSKGFENAQIMVCDFGSIKLSEDKKYLLLTLFEGESFGNVEDQKISNSSFIPYRRETFGKKEILIDFDSDFSRMDESILDDQYVSKNIKQLAYTIDSVEKYNNITYRVQAQELVTRNYFGREYLPEKKLELKAKTKLTKYNADSLFLHLNQQEMEMASSFALSNGQNIKNRVNVNNLMVGNKVYVNRHKIEWHKKFTLSFACLIFFFIGAPLGAIIRKGGLGLPVVISVIMFIFYYIIDNTGFKMAREGIWSALEGTWLSSAILLPLGIYLTYKAATDATLFNFEEYVKLWNRIKEKTLQIIKIKNAKSI